MGIELEKLSVMTDTGGRGDEMAAMRARQSTEVSQVNDDLDDFLDSHLLDVEFQAALEDVQARELLLEALLECRKFSKLSQSDVAKRMKTTQSAISELESQGEDPHLSTLQRYARAVECRLMVRIEADPMSPAVDLISRELGSMRLRLVYQTINNSWTDSNWDDGDIVAFRAFDAYKIKSEQINSSSLQKRGNSLEVAG